MSAHSQSVSDLVPEEPAQNYDPGPKSKEKYPHYLNELLGSESFTRWLGCERN